MRTPDQIIERAQKLTSMGSPGLIAVEFFLCQAEGLKHAIDIVRQTPVCGGHRILARLEREYQRHLTQQPG